MRGSFLGEPRNWADHPESLSVSLEHFNASEIGLNLGITLQHERKTNKREALRDQGGKKERVAISFGDW